MIFLQTTDRLPERLVIDASAGTGKTWSVVALITRELALREDLRIGHLLITTYTRNAAAELRDRLRKRLASSAQSLKSVEQDDADPLNVLLRDVREDERLKRAERLVRALSEFDSASISTIHGICSRLLRAGGKEIEEFSEESTTTRIIEEVTNDLLLTRADLAAHWNEEKLIAIVRDMARDPYLQPWFDAANPALTSQDRDALRSLEDLLGTAVARIHATMNDTPDFDSILRLAWQMVTDPAQAALLSSLQQRFQLAIVDEAQDTNRIQWELFAKLFPGGDGRSLVSVGDPKQSIYRFRGADVNAYLKFTSNINSRFTLEINRRSDQPLLERLNQIMANREFGSGIGYQPVHAPVERQASLIEGMSDSVEFVEVGDASNQVQLIEPAVRKVLQLLNHGRILSKVQNANGGVQSSRVVEPRDICVLVRSGGVGRLIQSGLVRRGIPAVIGGNSSVMQSNMARELHTLFEAMEHPASIGRVRCAAFTVFFGHRPDSVDGLNDREIEFIQTRLMHYSNVLTQKGLAAFCTAIESDESVMKRMVAGRHGERNLTDFLHVLEVMHSHHPGRGCTVEKALIIHSQLKELDSENALVSRRVESDADAVRILTIHAAKGLQFPCVLVADLWKKETTSRVQSIAFYDDDGERKIDIGLAVKTAIGDAGSSHAKTRWLAAEHEESRRLIYVAVTRAEHWLGILTATESQGYSKTDTILAQTMNLPEQPDSLENVPGWLERDLIAPRCQAADLQIASLPAVRETWRQQSFTGIAADLRGSHYEPSQETGHGYDEGPVVSVDDVTEPASQVKTNDLIELPAGTAVGTVVHAIFEHVDPSARPLREEVARVVNARVMGSRLHDDADSLISSITDSLETPLGETLDNVTLSDITPANRMCELRFDMNLRCLIDGIHVSDLGAKLRGLLRSDDAFFPYVEALAQAECRIPLGGLLNGTIDAVLRLPGSSPTCPRLLVFDYKSNKLHRTSDSRPLDAYAPAKLAAAMAHCHYPLQAWLYGVALYRFIRWRTPQVDADRAIVGFAYGFIRGMRGANTPVDSAGNRYGVFVWKAPAGLWPALSDFLSNPIPNGVNQ